MIAAAQPPRFLVNAAMRKIGEVSHSMYLAHFVLLAPSLAVAERLAPTDDWRTLPLHFVLTAGAAFLVACVTLPND